jgi:hypothetical protein
MAKRSDYCERGEIRGRTVADGMGRSGMGREITHAYPFQKALSHSVNSEGLRFKIEYNHYY